MKPQTILIELYSHSYIHCWVMVGIPYGWLQHFSTFIDRYTRSRINVQCFEYTTRWWPAIQ